MRCVCGEVELIAPSQSDSDGKLHAEMMCFTPHRVKLPTITALDTMSEEEREKLRRAFQESISKANNAWRMPIIEGEHDPQGTDQADTGDVRDPR